MFGKTCLILGLLLSLDMLNFDLMLFFEIRQQLLPFITFHSSLFDCVGPILCDLLFQVDNLPLQQTNFGAAFLFEG